MRRNSTIEPSLSDLILFIDEETTLLNDALFSRDAVSQNQEKKEKYDQKKKVNTFLAKTEIQTNESFKLKAQKEEIECPVCDMTLKTENVLKLGVEERSKKIFEKKLLWVLPKSLNKKSQECIMEKIAPTEKFVRCVMVSIQQHCMNWF